jgi:hypothetical protein
MTAIRALRRGAWLPQERDEYTRTRCLTSAWHRHVNPENQ